MPGDDWQKFANLRNLYTYMFATPGKKLLFMGGEFAQTSEWNHDHSLDWHLLDHAPHQQMQKLITDLNTLYKSEHALHQDCDPLGYEWVDASDNAQSIISFLRKGAKGETLLCVFNLTPVPRDDYKIGVPKKGDWQIVLNSDDPQYGGSGYTTQTSCSVEATPVHGRPYSINLSLPPLGGVMLLCK
jgi:1,4-alpha-glucan branching enzyme